MKKQREHYTGEEKVAILRRHLLDQEPVSKLCDQLGLQPTVFYPELPRPIPEVVFAGQWLVRDFDFRL